MKRFTEKRDGSNIIPMRNAVCGVDMPYWKISRVNSLESFLSGDAADRLAAYEDTGYTPEEVAQMGAALKMQALMVQEASAVWNAQQEGRVIVLPIKLGAKVRHTALDHVFTVTMVEASVVDGKTVLLYRCSSPETAYDIAFYDLEIGTRVEILPEEETNG